ncbi:hypothetical protein ABH944_004157 [Caballeronia udeis]|uniref:Uncharacterized protein n=1 Tax=Caballeronia udeis TaxID=1232866 RepID=A0ABW8MLA8_9BURK
MYVFSPSHFGYSFIGRFALDPLFDFVRRTDTLQCFVV